MKTRTIKVDDIYEAAYYALNGAKVEDYFFRKIPENKIKKAGHTKHWYFIMKEVDVENIRAWKEYKAVVNVRDYVSSRLNLKETMQKLQQSSY